MKHLKSIIIGAGMAGMLFTACTKDEPKLTVSGLDPAAFDTIIGNLNVQLFTLKNSNGPPTTVHPWAATPTASTKAR